MRHFSQILSVGIGYLLLKTIVFLAIAPFGLLSLPPLITAGFALIWLLAAALLWFIKCSTQCQLGEQTAPTQTQSAPILPTAAHDL